MTTPDPASIKGRAVATAASQAAIFDSMQPWFWPQWNIVQPSDVLAISKIATVSVSSQTSVGMTVIGILPSSANLPAQLGGNAEQWERVPGRQRLSQEGPSFKED